ncbi:MULTISPECIES: hypothetical protein [Methylobacterium]|uniref:hypothetical protein n=1 Tax=Methylobacterium TaxID=407 RepID=UPI002F351185
MTGTFTTSAIIAVDGDAVIGRSDARSVERSSQGPASREVRRSRVGLDHSDPGCQRRRTGQAVSDLLKKTQGERLALIGTRNREMAADDTRNLLLERLGLIRRIGDPHLHRLRGHPLIEWTITEAGRTALSDTTIAKLSF